MAILPMNIAEVKRLGWDSVDFVYVSGDSYVDHPSFGAAIITRLLEDCGYRVAFLAQPNWKSDDDFLQFGKPSFSGEYMKQYSWAEETCAMLLNRGQ